jgi:CheY-like chemotaxis protein
VDEPLILLFVDDDLTLLRVIGRVLGGESGRWSMIFATHARRGIDILASSVIDVLVTDLEMPDAGGAEVIAAAKRNSPGAVRILMTGAPHKANGLDAHVASSIERISLAYSLAMSSTMS